MTSPELLRSWKRTEGYLREARAQLSQISEAEFDGGLAQFEEFVDHNELGLAFEALEAVAEESAWESPRVFELLALAASSMGRHEKQRELDAMLTELRGWPYQTQPPRVDD